MIVLGFDTATAATVVALLDSGASPQTVDPGETEVVPGEHPERPVLVPCDATERRHDPAPGERPERPDRAVPVPCDATERRHDPAPGERPGHAAQLLTLAHELLYAAGITFADVDRIAVGLGPGGFTGLRIGVATARALAQGAHAEIVGVSTLETLACAAEPDPGQGVLAVIDARRGEVFVAGWRDGKPVLAQRAVAPDRIAALGASGWLAVGNGALRFREDLQRAGCIVPPDGSPRHAVSARTLCRLALRARQGTERELVVPDYLRKPDAVRSKP